MKTSEHKNPHNYTIEGFMFLDGRSGRKEHRQKILDNGKETGIIRAVRKKDYKSNWVIKYIFNEIEYADPEEVIKVYERLNKG